MVQASELVIWVDDNYPEAIKFHCNKSDIASIDVYLTYHKEDTYGTMIMMYGIIFFLAAIEYFAEIEEYERCAKMLSAIKRINNLYGVAVPTSLHSKWVTENINLTPSEILKKYYKH